MICPNCRSAETYIKDSRDQGEYRRRRYVCRACGERFSTREYAVEKVPRDQREEISFHDGTRVRRQA